MQKLTIINTSKSPSINFNPETGLFEMSGVSLIENTLNFYQPIINWLKSYIKNPSPTTKFIFKLHYSNTSSYKNIYDMLSVVNSIHNNKTNLIVEWYYASDDLDMRSIGEDYQESLNVEFNFIEVDVNNL
ncbi:MAG: hypothetical protein KFKLKKLM_01718 [Flavobacteriales bacterium]|nr:hypothetical protein [Flavobacteriales bacterium]